MAEPFPIVSPAFVESVVQELSSLNRLTRGERAAIEKILKDHGPDEACNLMTVILKANEEGK